MVVGTKAKSLVENLSSWLMQGFDGESSVKVSPKIVIRLT